MDGEGESRDSIFAAAVVSNVTAMFGLWESWRGLRLARFSGENRNELSESFFFGAADPKRNVLPRMAAAGEEEWRGMPKGHSAERWRRLSGLG